MLTHVVFSLSPHVHSHAVSSHVLRKISESTVTSNDLLNRRKPHLTNEQEQGDLLQKHKERVENFLNDGQLVKICADAGFMKRLLPNSIF